MLTIYEEIKGVNESLADILDEAPIIGGQSVRMLSGDVHNTMVKLAEVEKMLKVIHTALEKEHSAHAVKIAACMKDISKHIPELNQVNKYLDSIE